MPWQQSLLTFWPWVEFQPLMVGDGFSSVVIRIPSSCSGHMKPGWRETSLPGLSAADCLAHHTCLSGELSSFFNADLPAASSECQGGSCRMDVQPRRAVRGQLERPAKRGARGCLDAENGSLYAREAATLSSAPALSHTACSQSTQGCVSVLV